MYNSKAIKTILILVSALVMVSSAIAGTDTYIVKKGDTLWRIASTYKVGVSEIIDANPQIKNPDLIYPYDKVTIPLPDEAALALENEVIALVNQERKKMGLQPLKRNWEVSRVAWYKSKDMAVNDYFSHNSAVYGSPFDMLSGFKIPYRYAGENIAKGQKTATAVMNAWMNSSGHRANILNKNFNQIGVGFYEKDGVLYWTQMFID